MILLVVVRRAFCEVCGGYFDLPPGHEVPPICKLCGSFDWLYGPESVDGRLVRQGIKFAEKRLNPGVKSKKRQDRAKAQWRQLKPKPVDVGNSQGEN
jgi:hypothetical protein